MANVELPIAPRPYPDELFSSWIARVASTYDLNGGELRQSLFETQQAGHSLRQNRHEGFTDYVSDPYETKLLAQATRVRPKLIKGLSISEMYPGYPANWVAQLGIEDSLNQTFISSGQTAWAYCDQCLTEDTINGKDDYIRHSWILACYGYCHRHKTPLHQKCSECGSTNRFNYTRRNTKLHLTCTKCLSIQKLNGTIHVVSHGNIIGYGAGDKYTKRGHSIILDFETNIIKALIGEKPYEKWMGSASPAQFLAAIEDHLFMLVANHKSNHPREHLINHVKYYTFPNTDNLKPMVGIAERL